MRIWISIFFLVGFQLFASDAELVERAKVILDGYHGERGDEPRLLRMVYWTPKDREPAPEYRERLTRIMKHIEGYYGREMKRLGWENQSINLDLDENGLLEIPMVTGAMDFSEYARESGRDIRKECVPVLREAGYDPERETVMIFCNMGEWDEEARVWKHRSPYYAGGSHRAGTGWQVDSPILDTTWLDKKKPMMKDGEYGKISMGKHNSIFIGGIAHELGHALSLPHCKGAVLERDQGTALMGSGNRTYGDEIRGEGKGTFLSLASAMRLASHPQFSGSVKGMNQPAKGRFEDLEFAVQDDGFVVRGRVVGAPPVYGIVGYLDAEGRGDYDSSTVVAVPDESGGFELVCNDLTKGKSAELRIFGLHSNGATFREKFKYGVDETGAVNLQTVLMRQRLAPLLVALHGGEGKEAEVVRRIVSADRDRSKLLPPSQVAEKVSQIALSDVAAKVETVGWGGVEYDRLPGAGVLLEAAGEIYVHGIYAHAPAVHQYTLAGEWKTFTGKCGVAANHWGEVEFMVLVDGEISWRSGAVKGDAMSSFEISVEGADEVELMVDSLEDPGGDWGLWLEPVLSR